MVPSITRPQPIENIVSATNSDFSDVEHVTDVVERMAGRFQHPRQKSANLDDVALLHPHIDQRNFRGLVVRRNDAAIGLLLQFTDAADMIAVMVGHQDIGQRPALALQRLDDRGCLRRIDRGGRLGRGIMIK